MDSRITGPILVADLRALIQRSEARVSRHWAFPDTSDREPQHLDKLLVRGAEPHPASELISPRRGYLHHGIHVGDGKVVLQQEVIRRARSRLGEHCYRILRNNCEHFCAWCLRGESRSYQVERFLSSHPALGMILEVMGGRLSFGNE